MEETNSAGTAGSGGAVRLGIAGAVLAFVVLSALHAWTVPTFVPVDEASHWGYARELSRGHLPTIETPIPADGVPRLQRFLIRRDPPRRTIWTANHPPLFYLLEAVPVGIGDATGHPLGALRAGRLLSVALGALGVVLVGLLARVLVPERPRLAVAAAGLAALLPTFVRTSGLLFNDSLAVATSTATLLAAAIWVRRGPSPARLALVAATASAAALTRASGLIVVGVAGLAVLAGAWVHSAPPAPPPREGTNGGEPARRAPVAWWRSPRLLGAVRAGAVVGLAVALTSGWFWVRNRTLYGSFTGSGALLERFDRAAGGSVLGVLRSPWYWLLQQQRLWDFSFDEYGTDGSLTRWAWLVGLVPLAGLLVAGVRWGGRRRPAPATIVAWALGLGLLALLELSVAGFAAEGGGAHARYLLPGLGVLALLGALGLAALPGGRSGLVTTAVLVGMAAVDLWVWDRYLRALVRPPAGRGAVEFALAAAQAPGLLATMVPALLLLVAALAAQAVALWTLADPRSGTPVPDALRAPGRDEPVSGPLPS